MTPVRQRHWHGGSDAKKILLCLKKQTGQALIPRPLAGRSCLSCCLRALPGTVGWRSVGCLMKDMGTEDPRLCMGCKDGVRFMSHMGPVSHRRMWVVSRAQSWGSGMEVCMLLNERHRDRRSQALHGVQGYCQVHVPCVPCVSSQDVGCEKGPV